MSGSTHTHPLTGLVTRIAFSMSAATITLVPMIAHGATPWSRTYGGAGTYEQPLDVREQPDGTLIVAGVSDSFGTMSGDVWWLHLGADGGVISERVHGNALAGGAADATLDPDGGMAVVGAHTLDIFSDRDAWAHHVDAAGNVDWAVSFDADPGMHAFYGVAPTSDGGYVAVGSTAFDNGIPIHAWMVRFDGAGSVLWQRQYHAGVAEHANFVVETEDGGFAVAGWTTSTGAGMTDVWLMKTDSAGAIEWQKTYGGADQEEATGLIQTSDGGYALSAFTGSFSAAGHGGWVLRLDPAGEVMWTAAMGDVWGDVRDVVQTQDDDLVVTGRLTGPATNDLWLVKLRDVDGTVVWQRSYEGAEGDWGSRSVELADGDLLVGGIWGYGFPEEDMWLQRTDATGLVDGCALIADTDLTPSNPRAVVADAEAVPGTPRPVPEPIAFVSSVSTAVVDTKCGATIGVEDPDPSIVVSSPLRLVSSPGAGPSTIVFELSGIGPARVDVHDVSGRLVDTVYEGPRAGGRHEIRWPSSDSTPGGVYYVTLHADGQRWTERLVLTR